MVAQASSGDGGSQEAMGLGRNPGKKNQSGQRTERGESRAMRVPRGRSWSTVLTLPPAKCDIVSTIIKRRKLLRL